MKQAKLMLDLGTQATFFGLGLLASKKLRPYAKYFIIGGVAATAVPCIMIAVEQIKAKKACQGCKAEEVMVKEESPCCQGEASRDADTECVEALAELPLPIR